LIISPFNYPWKLAIEPFITAVAAGCPVVVKPSEITPRTNEVLRSVVEGPLNLVSLRVFEGFC